MQQRTMFQAKLVLVLYPLKDDGLEVKMPKNLDKIIARQSGENDDSFDELV